MLPVHCACPDFVDKGMAHGLYVTSTGHATEALSTTALQQVAKGLTGQEFAAKDLVRSKPGLAHVQVRLGSHSALLGWQDGALVEANSPREPACMADGRSVRVLGAVPQPSGAPMVRNGAVAHTGSTGD